jgi:hypothetical protein
LLKVVKNNIFRNKLLHFNASDKGRKYGEISDYTREPSFTSYADPSLTVCGTARDSAKPPKIQPVQRLNSCYFIEDVTKRSAEIPKFRYFGMNKSGLSLPSLPPKSATHQSLAHADGFMQFPIH